MNHLTDTLLLRVRMWTEEAAIEMFGEATNPALGRINRNAMGSGNTDSPGHVTGRMKPGRINAGNASHTAGQASFGGRR